MLFESIKMAVNSLVSNKMRSLLTMLGIVVGIASVIAVISLGNGGKNQVLGEFNRIGAATVEINVKKANASDNDYITVEDIMAIRKRDNLIKYASGYVQKMGAASNNNKNKVAMIYGIDEQYTSIASYDVLYGRRFTDSEFTDGRNVAILDEDTAKELFGTVDAVGETVTFGSSSAKMSAKVVGVIESMTGGMASMAGSDMSDNMPVFIIIPVNTALKLFPDTKGMAGMLIMATSADNADSAGSAAVRTLSARHNNSDREVYKATNIADVLDQFNSILGIITGFISAVAAISLLVGGIGVMNIMLVSVTERTREIGIRKAIGATTRDILSQFITESIGITLIGGIIGVILGLLASTAIGLIANITPEINVETILIAVLFSSAVGLFFGIYPARKAARLDPIEALRHE